MKRTPRPLVGKSANEPSPKVLAEALRVLLQDHRQQQAREAAGTPSEDVAAEQAAA
jgi:hypothetical protein